MNEYYERLKGRLLDAEIFLNEKNGKVWHVHLIKAACDKNNRETEWHGDQDPLLLYIFSLLKLHSLSDKFFFFCGYNNAVDSEVEQ